MHELQKIAEASYFLRGMMREENYPKHFEFELSAFLSAARSVLQYARKEAITKPQGPSWYDEAVTHSSKPIITYFKNKRDANIHSTPVKPATRVISRHEGVLVIDEETIIPHEHITSEYAHRFTDWAEDESVVELAERYLNALRAFVEEGIEKKLISG